MINEVIVTRGVKLYFLPACIQTLYALACLYFTDTG